MYKSYAAYWNNNIRMESSSGGLFSAFAECFDVVYGVSLSEDCYSAQFDRIANSDFSKLRGSKYFQAQIGDTYIMLREDLMEGKRVLFSGTSCQINGLKAFLQKEYINLYCIDVICHGVPSPKLWREYVHYQETTMGKLHSVNFRCKDKGWKNFGMKENETYLSKDDDSFMRMFLRDYCLRPSCYECIAKKNKQSDITIADFWGIESVAPELDDDFGTSLVIVRTPKGEDLFRKIRSKLVVKEVDYQQAIKHNPAEKNSALRPKLRDSFYVDLELHPFKYMVQKYAADIKHPSLERIKRKTKRVIKRLLKIVLKK